MVVLIGFILFVSIMLTRLTYRVHKQSHEIKRINLENKLYLAEIEALKYKLHGQEQAQVTEAKTERGVYAD